MQQKSPVESSTNYTDKNKSRPVAESHLEIAETFQDAGTRPIEESPDFLVSDSEDIDNLKQQDISVEKSSQSKINNIPPLD